MANFITNRTPLIVGNLFPKNDVDWSFTYLLAVITADVNQLWVCLEKKKQTRVDPHDIN
jgi:hypothetical protein